MTQVGDTCSTQRNARIEIHSIFAGSCVASITRRLLASYSEAGLSCPACMPNKTHIDGKVYQLYIAMLDLHISAQLA